MTKNTTDSVKNRKRVLGDKVNLELLSYCEKLWLNWETFRQERHRNINYVYVDQLSDKVKNDKGEWVTERERLAEKMEVPLQNNHMFRIVNTLEGVYIKSETAPVCFARQEKADAKSMMMTNALQTNYDNNEMPTVLLSELDEMILGGLPIASVEWTSRNQIDDAYTFPINPDYVFMDNTDSDPRMWGVVTIGEIRDYTLNQLASALAKNEYDYKQLEHIYAPYTSGDVYKDTEISSYQLSWQTPPRNTPCRTYRIWTLETKPRYRCFDPLDFRDPVFRIETEDKKAIDAENDKRIAEAVKNGWITQGDIPFIKELMRKQLYDRITEVPVIETYWIDEPYWHFQILSPFGDILDEYDTPFEHKEHPYVFAPFNWIDGRPRPYISIIRDQQRYINRLISLNDLYMQNAAVGMWMVPKSVLGGQSPESFHAQFKEFGGMYFYTPDPKNPNAVPQYVQAQSTNIGAKDLLQLELNFVNEISNVSSSLQGDRAQAGTSASRYAMETQNSTTSISSLFAKFGLFEHRLATKTMKVIHQYYTEPRNISVRHSNGYANYGMYYPQEVQDIDFVIKIQQGADTPVARMMLNDLVTKLWQAGVFSAKQMLQHGYFPGSEQILLELDHAEQTQQQGGGQPLGSVNPQLMQQATNGGNANVQNIVQQALAA